MEQLDGDDVRLVNRAGQRAGRDIVQFVPMRDFVGKSNHLLAKEVSGLMAMEDTDKDRWGVSERVRGTYVRTQGARASCARGGARGGSG